MTTTPIEDEDGIEVELEDDGDIPGTGEDDDYWDDGWDYTSCQGDCPYCYGDEADEDYGSSDDLPVAELHDELGEQD
jgi:sulfatase maturation enzyme AslB (radical SAM superfamily)